MATTESSETKPPVAQVDTWVLAKPYVVPMVGFLVLTAIEGSLPTAEGGGPSPFWYPLAYSLKMVLMVGLLWWCRSAFNDLLPRPSAAVMAVSAVVGVLVIVAWVGLDGRYPEIAMLGKRTAFDPVAIPAPWRYGFLAVRFFGLVMIVPIIEELFYRDFLMRWVVDPDIRKVPIGTVTGLGLGATTLVFTMSHPEWLPAALTAIAWGLLVRQTKSVSACVLSHAVANFVLGVYVLVTGEWKYW